MKILYVITKGNWGGAQKYVFELATHIPHPDFEVKVACGEGETLPEKLKAAWVPVIELPRLGRDVSIVNDTAVFFNLISLFKKERPDIVHLNSSKIGGIGALAARIAGIKKIIFTVHGFAFNENRPWIQKKIIAFISWLSIVLCTDVIFISEQERTIAITWPGVKNKAHHIYNGIASPQFLKREEARQHLAEHINQPLSLFENNYIVGTIGELTENKGYRFALPALKDIPNILYIIIGQGEQYERLKEMVRTQGLSNKVFFAGFIPDASTLLKAFDLFLLPSLKEGMPYVLLEAGFAQTPVIATDVGGVREIISDQKSGIIIPARNADALKKALVEAMKHKDLLGAYSQSLHEHVTKNFTLSKMVDETVYLYSSA